MDENNTGKSVLPFKLQQLIGTIVEKKGLGVEDALEYLYSSKLYEKLSTDSPLLWRLSTANLYDLLKTEKLKTKHAQNVSSPVLLFLAFCVENYKEHKQIDAGEVVFLFRKYGVIEYLISGFDVLHTQGREYIMADIDRYIKNHR